MNRRNIFPFDANDSALRWCKDCDSPYMPAGGCDTHVGRCLTCCAKSLDGCIMRMSTPRFRAYRRTISDQERAQVQAEIDSLYGPPGDQR